MDGIIPGFLRMDAHATRRTLIRVRKFGPCPAEEQLGERRPERVGFMAYNRHDAPQLKILKVIHLALKLFLRIGIFGIRILPIGLATGSTPPNVVVHLPCKYVNLMTVGKRNPSKSDLC